MRKIIILAGAVGAIATTAAVLFLIYAPSSPPPSPQELELKTAHDLKLPTEIVTDIRSHSRTIQYYRLASINPPPTPARGGGGGGIIGSGGGGGIFGRIGRIGGVGGGGGGIIAGRGDVSHILPDRLQHGTAVGGAIGDVTRGMG